METQATAKDNEQQTEVNDQNKTDTSDAKIDNEDTYMRISRKVFSGKQWLTIEDWLECNIPLCALEVKHEGRIERSHDKVVQTLFASSRLGGSILSNGWSQVSLTNHSFIIS